MALRQSYSQEFKDLVVQDLKNGMKVKEVAIKYSVKEDVVYAWKLQAGLRSIDPRARFRDYPFKDEFLERLRLGEKLGDLAKEYGVPYGTAHNWKVRSGIDISDNGSPDVISARAALTMEEIDQKIEEVMERCVKDVKDLLIRQLRLKILENR